MQSDQSARNGMVLSVSKGSFFAAHSKFLSVGLQEVTSNLLSFLAVLPSGILNAFQVPNLE
jgi:hypothetical protein